MPKLRLRTHSYGVAASQDALPLRLERSCAFGLPALGASVAEARRRVRTLLRLWGVADEVRDDAEMVISELFTNAVRHTASERICCELWVAAGQVRLEVTDEGSGLTEPQRRTADVDEEGGRGLLLVGLLSRAWGVRPGSGGRGRTVWAELTV